MSNDSPDNENENDSQTLSSSSSDHLDSSLGVDKIPIRLSSKQLKSKEKTEILYGEEAAMDGITRAMYNVKNNADVCGNNLSPSFSMGVKQIKNGYIDFKRRGVKIRFITEITKDNIDFCKELMQYVELRHTPAVKGNMAVSEQSMLPLQN